MAHLLFNCKVVSASGRKYVGGYSYAAGSYARWRGHEQGENREIVRSIYTSFFYNQ
jgi:hypothetical protein